MPRNGSGGYALPEAAFIPNTAISSSAMNSDLSDIGDALTGSLARDGQGGMTAVLPLANTGFTYLTDPNTGIRRTGADVQAISGGGNDTLLVSSTGVTVAGALVVSGAILMGGAPIIPIGLGPLPWSGLSAPAKWVLANGQTLLRASFPDFWTFIAVEIAAGNTLYTNGNGSTTFTVPDLSGRLTAGKDNMAGPPAGRLTSTTMTPDGNTLGAVGGLQTRTLVTGNLPAYTPAGNLSITATVPFTSPTAYTNTFAGGAQNIAQLTGATAVSFTSATFTGTAQGGTSTPVLTVQPTIVTNFIIYAGA